MPIDAQLEASPLVGEVGGGLAASAAEKTRLSASPAGAADAPPPNPPHKGEGLRRLSLAADATQHARRLRANMTDAERLLWRALREAFPSYHWRKQVPLGRYFADFASHSAKLVVELDGGQHSSSRAYDEARTRFIEQQGFSVVRFWNTDVLSNTDGVLHTIAQRLSETGGVR